MVNDQLRQIMDKLKEYDIDDNTIIFLCGDNGGAPYFRTKENPRGLFAPNVDPKTGQAFRQAPQRMQNRVSLSGVPRISERPLSTSTI